MFALGLDLGASSVKLALLENGKIKSLWMQTHQGRPFEYLQNGLEMLNLHEKAAVCVTGANSEALLAACPELTGLGDIPATVEGVRLLAPQGGSIMEIGSQGARFITGWQSGAPQYGATLHRKRRRSCKICSMRLTQERRQRRRFACRICCGITG